MGTGAVAWLNDISFPVLILACLTLGLSPFVPEPHLFEKLKMLRNRTLRRPLDIFDLCLHAAPFVLLLLKLLQWPMLT